MNLFFLGSWLAVTALFALGVVIGIAARDWAIVAVFGLALVIWCILNWFDLVICWVDWLERQREARRKVEEADE